jgi:integrase
MELYMKTTDFFEQWLAIQEPVLARSTYEAYTVYFRKHIEPFFSALELEEVKPMDVQQYVMGKLHGGRMDGKCGGLSSVSVKKHLSLLKQSLDAAVIFGYLPQNPCAAVRLPRRKGGISKRAVLLTAEEAQRVIDAFEGHPLHVTVVLALYYGLRRSEVLGLKWSAVDFDRDTLMINHTVVKNLTIEAKDTTKTETSARSFELLPEVKTLLLDHYAARRSDAPYIHTWEDGRIFRPDYVTRAFQRVLAAHDLPRMRFHDLRHSTASILFDMGWGLEDVKNWLGHSDIETTSNIYLHYNRSRKVLLADRLAGTFQIAKRA